jgi:heme exporter protein B
MKGSNIVHLIKREMITESRKKSTLISILLFTLLVVYLIYKTFITMKAFEWNVLFWIVLLFSGVNAVAKSFMQEGNSTRIFDYTIFHPIELILSKIIYYFLFLMLIFTIILIGFSFFLTNPVKDYGLFFLASVLGLLGIAMIYTFVNAISSHSDGGSLLMSVMALPLTLPILLILLKTSATSMRLMQDSTIMNDVMILAAIDLMAGGIILLLFKTVWKE